MSIFSFPAVRRFGTLTLMAAAACSACNSTSPEPSTQVVASVEVSPASAQLEPGQTVQLTARVLDDSSNPLLLPVEWDSEATQVANVDDAGLVTAGQVGETQVSATVEGVSGTASIEVVAPPQQAADVEVNVTQVYQTVLGWEGNTQLGQTHCANFDALKDELIDRLANELGINRVRLVARVGLENTVNYWQYFPDPPTGDYVYTPVNDNDDPNVADLSRFFMDEIDAKITTTVEPLRQALAARGEKLWVTLIMVDFGTTSFHKEQPEEYAEFMEVVFDHIQSTYGWSPDAIEVILEPDLQGAWQPDQIANVIAATAPRLSASGYTPEFIAPSVETMSNAVPWTEVIAQNQSAMQYLTDISYHRYNTPPPGQSRDEAAAIGTLAAQLGVRTAMLERIDAGLDVLWEDLTVANNSAWMQFSLAGCNDNLGAATYYATSSGSVVLRPKNRPFLQIFPFVRTGAVRHGTTVRDSSLRAMAFLNGSQGGSAAGKWAVIVETQGATDFTVGGLPDGTYDVSYTGEDGAMAQSLGQVTAAGGVPVTVQMPAAGVVTVFGG